MLSISKVKSKLGGKQNDTSMIKVTHGMPISSAAGRQQEGL